MQHNFHLDVQLHVPPNASSTSLLPYIPNRQKCKLCSFCQVILLVVGGVMVLSASFRYITAMSKTSTAVTMATAIWCIHIPLSSSTAMLSCMFIFIPLLRSPVQTQVIEFNCFAKKSKSLLQGVMVQFPKVFLHSNISLPDSFQTLIFLSTFHLLSHVYEDSFLSEYDNHLLHHVYWDHIYMSAHHTCNVPSSG